MFRWLREDQWITQDVDLKDGKALMMVVDARHFFFCLVIVTAFGLFTSAGAGVAEYSDTVADRYRPELKPLGLTAGGFWVYPAFGLTGEINDNIFATNDNAIEDFITIISPGLLIKSNWNNHALNAKAYANIGRYKDFETENYEDGELSVDGQFNIKEGINLDAGASTGRFHVPRFSPDDNFGLVPTIYTTDDLFARYGHKRGKYSFTLDTSFGREDYDDVPGLVNGVPTIINQDYRDRDERVVELRGAYEYLSGSDVYISLKKIRRDYDNLQNVNSIDRSSVGYEIVIGSDFVSNEVITGDIFAGVTEQLYSDPQFDIKTPVLAANLDWNITTLTTIGVNIDHLLWPTTAANYVGYISTTGSITIDHELLRNLILNAGITRAEYNYNGIDLAVREDSLYTAKTGVSYMANRHFSVMAEYISQRRDSIDNTIPPDRSRNVSRNILYLQIKTQY